MKTILLSRLTHLFISIPNPENFFLNELERLFFKFIWNNKNDKISRNQLYQSYEKGGLKMVNVSAFIKSLKLNWIKRLILNNSALLELFQSSIKSTLDTLLKTGPEYIKKLTTSNHTINPFWKDVLQSFYEFRKYVYENEDKTNFIYQEIWHNHNIRVDNKTVYYKRWVQNNIIYIYDLFNEHGTLLNYNDFCQKYGFYPPITVFYGIQQSILRKWPNVRYNNFQISLPHLPDYLNIIIKNKKNKISIYDIFIKKVIVKNDYITKWCNEFNIDEEEIDKYKVNKMPFSITTDTTLRWFQYRLLHRILPTNTLLLKMRISDSSICNFCNVDEESLLHLFFTCRITNTFWRELFAWLNMHCQLSLNLDKEIIIFGKNLHEKYSNSINLTLILAKQFIFSMKMQKRKPELTVFINKLKHYYDVEKYIYAKTNRMDLFKNRWEKLSIAIV